MIPLFSILLAVSVVFKLFPPRSINSFYGYRTKRSMENSESWKVANEYSATLMLKITSSLFTLALVFNFLSLNFNTLLYTLLGLSVLTMVVLTEKKLAELI